MGTQDLLGRSELIAMRAAHYRSGRVTDKLLEGGDLAMLSISLKRRLVHGFQRRILNPVGRRLPGVVMLETTGRKTGRPRRTVVSGRRLDETFWMVSEHGHHSHYVSNIKADPAVRLRIRGRWRKGIAHLLDDDNPLERLSTLPWNTKVTVRAIGTDLLTIRIDLN
ncbi:nitroreductase [Mycobacteroides abscessus subsp. abscessus]|nr:hypothetical protein M879_22790 [Mycobacteroides abscessus V06705]SIF91546.1 nitroreductase [Mycobacteroides abscessus subsp. abscessus]